MANTNTKLKLYHGTSKENANNIIKKHCFYLSCSDEEWLGEGIYFFPFIKDALWWSTNAKKYKNPMVLLAILEFQNDQFLDLDKPNNLCAFNHCFEDFLEHLSTLGGHIPQFSKESPEDIKKLWCYASDVYKYMHTNVKLMAYTFDTPQELLCGFHYRQRQLCATDNTIITKICKEENYNGNHR